MTEFLMLVTLWCGNPGYSRITIEEVSSCRKIALKCYDSKSPKDMWRCFEQIKVGKLYE